jgi:hypothetical protein
MLSNVEICTIGDICHSHPPSLKPFPLIALHALAINFIGNRDIPFTLHALTYLLAKKLSFMFLSALLCYELNISRFHFL